MSLSKVSPFYSSAPSMFTDSQPKFGNDSVPFYIDFGSHPNRFGRFTVSQRFRKEQNYSEPTFQVFNKDKCGTFEKYQQLRIGDFEFKKFCLLKNNLLNGDWETQKNPAQFEMNPKMEDVLQQCQKAREISIGKNRRPYVPLYIMFRTIQLQFMSKSDYFVPKGAMSSTSDLRQL